jgi:hypothetical protein
MEELMRRLWLITVVTLLLCSILTGTGFAKSVYLKDGAILDCQSFWRKGDQVIVMVNRDIMLRFSKDEVNLKKTFAKRAGHRAKKHAKPVALSNAAVVAPQAAPRGGTDAKSPGAVQGRMSSAKAKGGAVAPAQPAAKTPPPVAGAQKAPAPAAPKPAAQPMPVRPEVAPPVAVPPVPMAAVAKMGATSFMVIGIVALIVALLIVAASWKIYEKAGYAGWKSLIPIYNFYILVLIVGKPWWWFLLMFVPVVSVAIYLLVMLSLAERFGKGPLFGIGLFFVPFICYPVLAFDGSEYNS